MLSCKEILARHSEYIDGEMAPDDSELWRAHLASCPLCARYDRVLRKGVRLLSASQPTQPDPAFILHLHHRLAEAEARAALRPVTIGAAASVSIAATLALAAWLPIMVAARDGEPEPLTPVASAPVGLTATEIAWHGDDGVKAAHSHARPGVRLQHTIPGVSLIERRYTPLILEAPTAPPSYTRVVLTSIAAD